MRGVRLQGRDRYHGSECIVDVHMRTLRVNGIPESYIFQLAVSPLVGGVFRCGKKFLLGFDALDSTNCNRIPVGQ